MIGKTNEHIIFRQEDNEKKEEKSPVEEGTVVGEKESEKEKVMKEAFRVIIRTIVNLLIIATDFFPLTEGISWLADIAKIIRNSPRLYRYLKYDLDPTPDVRGKFGIGIAVGSEFVEPLTGGFFPSHAIESSIQFFQYDLSRLLKALKYL